MECSPFPDRYKRSHILRQPSSYQTPLCVDDYSISFLILKPQQATRLLQMAVDKISEWSSNRGFRTNSNSKSR